MSSSVIEIEKKRRQAHDLVDLLMDKQVKILEEEKNKGIFKGKADIGNGLFTDFSKLETCLLGWYYDHVYGAFCRYHYLDKPSDFDWDVIENINFDIKYSENILENEGANIPYPLPYEEIRDYASLIFEHKARSNCNYFVYNKLAYALRALNDGEVHLIVTPKKAGNAGNKHTLDLLRWASVMHVWAEHGILGDRKKHIAISTIAEEIGVTTDQLISWEKSIGKKKDPNRNQREQYKKVAKLLLYRKREDINGEWANSSNFKIDDNFSKKTQEYTGFVIHYPTEIIKEYMRLAHEKPEKVNLEWSYGHWPKVIFRP